MDIKKADRQKRLFCKGLPCIQDLPKDQEDALREVLDMMACKAAVKAGDHLSGNELDALLDLRHGHGSTPCQKIRYVFLNVKMESFWQSRATNSSRGLGQPIHHNPESNAEVGFSNIIGLKWSICPILVA